MALNLDKLKHKDSHLCALIEMADTISKEHNESKNIQVSLIDCKSRLYNEHVQLQAISKLIHCVGMSITESTEILLLKEFLETCVSAIDSINLNTLLDDLIPPVTEGYDADDSSIPRGVLTGSDSLPGMAPCPRVILNGIHDTSTQQSSTSDQITS